jgi:hypothetical protein
MALKLIYGYRRRISLISKIGQGARTRVDQGARSANGNLSMTLK